VEGHRVQGVRRVVRQVVIGNDVAGCRYAAIRHRVDVGFGDRGIVADGDVDLAFAGVTVGILGHIGEAQVDDVIRVAAIGVIQHPFLNEGIGTVRVQGQDEDRLAAGGTDILVVFQFNGYRNAVRSQLAAGLRTVGSEAVLQGVVGRTRGGDRTGN